MMDLKTINVSVTSDVGSIEGTALDLVVELREIALSDVFNMIEQELSIDNEEYTDTVEDYIEDPFLVDEEEENQSYERQPVAEIVDLPETSDENVESDYSLLFNTDTGVKINTFSNVITEFDNIIKTNGVVADNITVTYIVNKFKTLDGVHNTYGEFVVSTDFTTV